MAGRGLVIAGGIVAIARGGLQTIIAGGTLPAATELDELIPGIAGVLWYELLMGIALVIGGIVVLTQSGKPESGNSIQLFGYAAIILGVIDLSWGLLVVGNGALAAGLGSLAGCAVAGALMIAGGRKLDQSRSTTSVEPVLDEVD